MQGNLPVYGLPGGLSGKESASQYPLENIWQYPLEKKRAMHSSILAWKIPWTEPRGLQSRGLQKVRLDSQLNNSSPSMPRIEKWQSCEILVNREDYDTYLHSNHKLPFTFISFNIYLLGCNGSIFITAHRIFNCSMWTLSCAHGIQFPDQGSIQDPCTRRAESLPLDHQGNLCFVLRQRWYLRWYLGPFQIATQFPGFLQCINSYTCY